LYPHLVSNLLHSLSRMRKVEKINSCSLLLHTHQLRPLTPRNTGLRTYRMPRMSKNVSASFYLKSHPHLSIIGGGGDIFLISLPSRKMFLTIKSYLCYTVMIHLFLLCWLTRDRNILSLLPQCPTWNLPHTQ
jgi:hypothetical protein